MFPSIFVYLGLAANVVMARPASREVVAPPITFPTANTVWTVGQKTHVDWDTSSLPPYNQITNNKGQVVLGYEDPCDPDGGEHLDLDHPLADGFNITIGTIPITVPNVRPRSDYIIVLFGDSGNLSPKFSINVAISDGNGNVPPVRAVCTSSTTSSHKASTTSTSTSTSPAAASTSTSKSTTSSVSSTSTDVPTTITLVTSQLTHTTAVVTSTGISSSPSFVASNSASVLSSSHGSTSVQPTALPQSKSASATQSQSTSSASSAVASRLVAILSGMAAVFLAIL